MARIYVASSWRNPYFPEVVTRLREAGHEVYDFRNPPHGGAGFHWTDVDPDAPNWTYAQYAEGLHHPLAERQFQADIDALTWADTCVAYLPEMVEPELMYKLFDGVAGSLEELVEKLYLDRDVEFLRPGLSE